MSKRLYVGNLPYTTDEHQLRQMFEDSGKTVADVHVVTDRETGRSRGFGFVELESEDEAQQAISELNGREIDGRALTVNVARERSEGGGGGGGGRRGGGGGGGGRRSSW